MDNLPQQEGDEDGAGDWIVVGFLMGIGALLLGLVVGSPVVFCAGPVIVAALLFLTPRVRAAGVGALMPALALVVLGLAVR